MTASVAVFAVFGIVLVVLAVAGAAKVVTPGPTSETLTAIGIRVGPGPVRLLGGVEVALAVATAVTALPILIWITAVLHLGFTAVVLARRRAHRIAERAGTAAAGGCGCFGNASAPPGAPHIVLTLGSAAVGAAAAVSAVSPTELFDHGLSNSVLTIGLILGAAFLEILILTTLAELFASFEPQPDAPATLALR